MSKPALLSLHQVLRRSFRSLESSRQVWASVLAECAPLVSSLENLTEQARALSHVHISDTPLKDIPDLEELLRFKLLQAMDTVLCQLHEKMASLQSVRDAISNHVSTVVQLYEQNADSLDLVTVTQRSAVIPSVADMLEWLQDAGRHYQQQFLRRKTLLHMLSTDDLSLLESSTKRWKEMDAPNQEDHIQDTLCKVSFFMESG
ncbi:AFG2-interacting ribosome maturation factor [Nerophis lumbriciformis]|uniref:AFG2-interacting ribosome maturation factor n=1 Tax=Nerophis lumbriciformis TaxID=546530 RepID=UPI002ADF43C6|nr:AFG2-interacting ribosome maturation factor [Nerophis lumbriciformis]